MKPERDRDTRYAHVKTLEGVSYDTARERVVAALADEGFGVLTEIDVKATLKEKLDEDFRPYVILGACNPSIAYQALQAEPDLGVLLPCNVIVQETAVGAKVSAMSPRAMHGVLDNPDLAPLMDEVDRKLRTVLDAIG